MNDTVALAVEHLRQRGATYADARLVEQRNQRLAVHGARVEAVTDGSSRGLGIRALADGAWGFAATADLSPAGVIACADLALGIARAGASAAAEPVALDVRPAATGTWTSPRREDPFAVELEQKIDLLRQTTAAASQPGIRSAKAHMEFARDLKSYADTAGADLEQDVLHTGAGLEVVAERDGQVQRVSWPSSHGGDWAATGYEWVGEMALVEHAGAAAARAVALLDAPLCPDGEYDLILAGPQLALQIHESCGHPSELDRALGTEVSLAGASFLTPDRLGKLRYGSEQVNLYGDATIPGALGTFGWDDEGVAAQRFDIVREGLFVGYQTSRETAARLGQSSNGTMRASSWSRLPLIRMTNINLAPDPDGPTLEELIADTRRGLLMEVNKSWSIDDLRLNFSFGCEGAWVIENGRRVGLVKNPVYTGITPRFWGSCDAVTGPAQWRVWGVPNCGKGQPMQIARVGHGCGAARFVGVRVGSKL